MTNLSSNDDSSGIDFKKIEESLIVENDFLTTLIDTIPANMYFGHDVKEKLMFEKHALMDEKAKALKRGYNPIDLSSAKSKHKRSRIDPLFQKSVTQIQQEMAKKERKKNKSKELEQSSASLTRAANIEELQKRLQDKIRELKLKRKASIRSNPEGSRKILASLKKAKSKKAKMEKEKKVLNPYKEPDKKNKTDKKAEKPVYNKENKIIYSQLDFSEDGNVEKKKSEFSGKNYKQILHKVEKNKEKIENLKATNPELASNLEEKEKWKKAILKAENVKIKDDSALLKKSIKRQEKIKKKKSKEWQERKEHVEHKAKARQEKRSKNIKQRKQEKLDRKIKLAKKKGRLVPGF